ncbi:MAG: hypothetical protein J0H08_13925 [Rhizobiales bacterium]|nr:hypothetical protein [Hyphomicrobiales bacterium]
MSVALMLATIATAGAQSAADRAGELKQWRERCADYDVDMRLAYIEQAIAEGDASVIRICSRLALESDDADIRNLGLRAALASMGRLQFDVTIPEVLESALKAAGGDRKKLDEISRWYVSRDWEVLQSGLVFEISEANITEGTLVLYAMPRLTKRSESYSGTATITGSRLVWVGSAYLAQEDCKIDVSLEPGAQLAGTLHCGKNVPFAIRGSLL